jgi:amino acid transporter
MLHALGLAAQVYLEYTYRRPRFLASSLVAAQAVLLGFTASNCIVFSKYVLFALSVQPSENQHKALAVALLTAVTIVHGCFLKTGILVQNVLGWVKIFLIGVMSLTGVWVVFLRSGTGDGDEISPTLEGNSFSWDAMWAGSNWSFGLLSAALFKVYYSYAGLNNVNNVLNEVRDPVGIVKTVCPTALVTAGALYFLANLSYFLVISLEEIKESGELVGALLFERLFGDHVGSVFFPLAIAVSAAGNVMVVTFALVCLLGILTRRSRSMDFPRSCLCTDNGIGTRESRDSTTGLPPMAEPPLIFETIWLAVGRIDRPLYSICTGHCITAAR